MRRLVMGLIMAAMATGGAVTSALAQSGADFFKGKTVNYIVATNPGGGYDVNGRLVAEFMQKYLPGSTFVVRNMAGAGHILGTNYVYASQPDGLTIGTFNTGLIYSQLAENAAIKFDLEKMSWIGNVGADPRVFLMSRDSGVEDYEQLAGLEKPIKFAAPGVGTASTIETTLLVDVLKLPIQVVTGYNGNDDLLAMRRGEVGGMFSFRSSFQSFVDEGHGHFIAQIGGEQTDVPGLAALVTDERARPVISLIEAQSNLARLTAGPPGIPEDRLQALRDAYAAATADPEFLKRAASLGLPIAPTVGQDVADAVTKAMDQPDEIVTVLKTALREK